MNHWMSSSLQICGRALTSCVREVQFVRACGWMDGSGADYHKAQPGRERRLRLTDTPAETHSLLVVHFACIPVCAYCSRGLKKKKKSGLHSSIIAKVRFSTFKFETGQRRPSNCQNRANLAPEVVLKVVFHFVRIKIFNFTIKWVSKVF